jgi:hypothetical protein
VGAGVRFPQRRVGVLQLTLQTSAFWNTQATGPFTTLYHLRNVVPRSFSTHQFVCNSTINGDCIERKRRSIK